jgi:hypothetical protein
VRRDEQRCGCTQRTGVLRYGCHAGGDGHTLGVRCREEVIGRAHWILIVKDMCNIMGKVKET